jgi:hypothetical protein
MLSTPFADSAEPYVLFGSTSCPQFATALPAPEIFGAHGAAEWAPGILIDIIRA